MGFQNGGRSGVTILVPSGTYRITQTLEIEQSNVVLKGEGVSRHLELAAGHAALHALSRCHSAFIQRRL